MATHQVNEDTCITFCGLDHAALELTVVDHDAYALTEGVDCQACLDAIELEETVDEAVHQTYLNQ